jgi:hypothetical protein
MSELGEDTDDAIDAVGTMTSAFDIFDVVRRIARGGGKAGGVDVPGLSAVSTLIDGYNVVTGTSSLVDGIREGDTQTGLEGVHDLLDGGSGLLSNAPGQLGAGAAAFGGGFALGDLMAPFIFSDVGEHDNDGPDADGVYRPSTGNGCIDWIIDQF